MSEVVSIAPQRERLEEKLKRELGVLICESLNDADITEVICNSDGSIWLESHSDGMIQTKTVLTETQVETLIGTVARINQAIVTPEKPILECELPIDGSRFEGLLPPVVTSPAFVIRKRAPVVFPLDAYQKEEVIHPWQLGFLKEALKERKNIIVSGSTGSGKTTLVNALLLEMAKEAETERFVLLEDTYELRCEARNCLHLHTSSHVDLLALARATMRLRPDRIVVGEVRGAEAYTLLKVWNTGHRGGVTTLHANSAEGALTRLELLVEEAGAKEQRSLIGETIDVVLFVERTAKGRKLAQILVVNGYDRESKQYLTEQL